MVFKHYLHLLWYCKPIVACVLVQYTVNSIHDLFYSSLQLVPVLKLATRAVVSRPKMNIHVGYMVESAFVMLSVIRRVVAVPISRLLAAVQVSNNILCMPAV